MHGSVSFNRELLDASSPVLPALSSASLFGKGIFTTIAVYDRKPFLWDKHRRRLDENSARLAIDLADLPSEEILHAVNELIKANSVETGRARVTLFDQSASQLWRYSSERRTSLLITTAELKHPSEDPSLTVSPYRVNSASPLAGVKSCNYLEKIVAKEEASRRGFDEAIQTNERGKIASASTANVFWLKDGKLFTPALSTGCLAGTTREFVLENLECEEIEVGIDELRRADEIFLTSAGLGVAQIASFDGSRLRRGPHPILKLPPFRD